MSRYSPTHPPTHPLRLRTMAALGKIFQGAERMPNGVDRAKKIPRKDTGFRKSSGNIAAIDFGTKNCSLAYVTERDVMELIRTGLPKLPLNGTHLRVPTAVLLNADNKVEAFGHDARTMYRNMEVEEKREAAFFEGIKMNLQRDQSVNRNMKVKALNEKEFLLVDVIAHILGFLKKELLEQHLQRGGHSFRATDFDWVVTVPAIWRARGKRMMREAAYKAGLCSEYQLYVVSSEHPPPQPLAEQSPDRLSLALEPESGAIYCHEMLKRGLVAPHCATPNDTPTFSSYSYLIVDIGGGTVDISAHKVFSTQKALSAPRLEVEELHPPMGNDWGGTKVNQEFSKFLQKLVGDRFFTRYVDTGDWETRTANRFDLDELLNISFEEQKQMFGRMEKERRKWAVVRLPDSFMDIYKDTLQVSLERMGEDVNLVRQNLRISPAKMEQFLSSAITHITGCVSDMMESISDTVNVIYLVGGFGGCPYVYEKFKELYGTICQIIVPPNPEFAIVEGAVLFRANPTILRARKADATYGKSVIQHFDEKIHDPDQREGEFCNNLFQTIIGVGETINPDHVYVCTSCPLSKEQPSVYIRVFSSPEEAQDVWYTTGDNVVKVGELEIDTPTVEGGKEREVEVTFDFSHTEIQVRAFEKVSGAEVKTVIDFLSS